MRRQPYCTRTLTTHQFTGGEETEWWSQSVDMGIIRRPWWSKANERIWPGCWGYTPTLFRRTSWDFLMTTESQDLSLTSPSKDGIQSNSIFHIYMFSSFINFGCADSFFCLIRRIVLLSHLPFVQQFGKHCHLQVHFETAAYEIPNWAKLLYRTVWNIIYTGTFPVPVYHAFLVSYIVYNKLCILMVV